MWAVRRLNALVEWLTRMCNDPDAAAKSAICDYRVTSPNEPGERLHLPSFAGNLPNQRVHAQGGRDGDSETYATRSFRFLRLTEPNGWRIKLYGTGYPEPARNMKMPSQT